MPNMDSSFATTFNKEPNFLPSKDDLIRDPAGDYHLLVQENSLKLLAWIVSGRNLHAEGISKRATKFITNSGR